MKLLLLHGAGAGKLTVAKALLQLGPGRLFDNHAAIDLARTLFDFGAPGARPAEATAQETIGHFRLIAGRDS